MRESPGLSRSLWVFRPSVCHFFPLFGDHLALCTANLGIQKASSPLKFPARLADTSFVPISLCSSPLIAPLPANRKS